MPEFKLDINGNHDDWLALDAFTQGFIEALFFTEEENLCEQSGGTHVMPNVGVNPITLESRYLGGNPYGFGDLAPASLSMVVEDCSVFQRRNAFSLKKATETAGYDMTMAGRDFWYTRNGHGVGYWDRGLGEVGETLTDACKKHRELDVYVGDDGKVYVG